jgi:Bacterial regulatory proteins, tetR family
MGLRERKKLRTRQTIERTAMQLFAKHGFHATTLAQIADAAEVAPSTLHAAGAAWAATSGNKVELGSDARIVVVLCGANVDPATLAA